MVWHQNVINKISEELENRINSKSALIEWIKWELFDVLTIWDKSNEDRRKICDELIKEISNKIDKAEKQEPKNQTYIDNLLVIKIDLEIRRDYNVSQNVEWKHDIIDLNEWDFDEKVLDSVVSSIFDIAKDGRNLWEDILISRLLNNDKYKQNW